MFAEPHWDCLQLAKREPDRFAKRLVQLWKRCPLRGCRASSIAMGCFHRFLTEEFDASAVKLMSRLVKYSPEDRDFGMADFRMSSSYSQTHIAVKLIPYSICVETTSSAMRGKTMPGGIVTATMLTSLFVTTGLQPIEKKLVIDQVSVFSAKILVVRVNTV